MDSVSRVVEDAVRAGTIAGAVALVRHRGEVAFRWAVGQAAREPEARPMSIDTVFDLASLTKPVVGATVSLALVDAGVVSLDEEVTRYLPELERLDGQGVTFRRLLTHTSGLPGWRPVYAWARGRQEVLATIDRLGLVTAPGTRFEYSDIGFITLGLALERATDTPLDRLATEVVFQPLRLETTGYLPSSGDFAFTERGNGFERRMATWAGLEFDGWRTGFHPGEVNDGNAHYALGGVSGHAGLFSDAPGLAVVGEMWRHGGVWEGRRILSPAAVSQATAEQTSYGARRGLGWQLARRFAPGREDLSRADAGYFPPSATPWVPWPSGELLSEGAYGHTGFTGTSIWIDPALEMVAVLLTNATHPEVDVDKGVNALRARFHNAVAASLSSGGGNEDDE